MAPTLPQFNPARLRSYIFRLPFLTRIFLLLIAIFWILELQSAWDVVQWGALIPMKVNLGTSTFNSGNSCLQPVPGSVLGRHHHWKTDYDFRG